MFVRAVSLFGYRNLTDGNYTFSPGVNLIQGPNGQGKTNLIEAIHVVATGRSFRTSKSDDLCKWGTKDCSVFADVETANGGYRLGVVIEDGERTASINDNNVQTLGAFIGKLPLVSFTPFDIDLIKGGPSERRRFIDRHSSELVPGLFDHHVHYQKALKHKNALLRGGHASSREIDPWNEILAVEGRIILEERMRFIFALQERAREIHSLYAARDGTLSFVVKSSFLHDNQIMSLEQIRSKLSEFVDREIAVGGALTGVHRDDVIVTVGERDARAFASQGQTRSVVLALKLAAISLIEARHGESPIVLLDDVDSELDRSRSEAFFKLLFEANRQIFVTATEYRSTELNRSVPPTLFNVSGGVISN